MISPFAYDPETMYSSSSMLSAPRTGSSDAAPPWLVLDVVPQPDCHILRPLARVLWGHEGVGPEVDPPVKLILPAHQHHAPRPDDPELLPPPLKILLVEEEARHR